MQPGHQELGFVPALGRGYGPKQSYFGKEWL